MNDPEFALRAMPAPRAVSMPVPSPPVAMDSDKAYHYVRGTSAFYRAMSLFRQGKEDQARELATEAAAKMRPLPNDEKNPLAGGGDANDLILWMAYKEAKAMIKFDPPAAVTAQPNGK